MPSKYQHGYLDVLAKSVDEKIEAMLRKMKPLTIRQLEHFWNVYTTKVSMFEDVAYDEWEEYLYHQTYYQGTRLALKATYEKHGFVREFWPGSKVIEATYLGNRLHGFVRTTTGSYVSIQFYDLGKKLAQMGFRHDFSEIRSMRSGDVKLLSGYEPKNDFWNFSVKMEVNINK